MRTAPFILVAFIGILALLAFAPSAEASTVCRASGDWCQGYSHTSTTTGGVSGTRCFALRTTNTAPTCNAGGITPVNEATWRMNAGACITFYYFDTSTGVSPPPTPNKVTITVYFDATTTTIKSYLAAGAEPANGSSYSLCATSTGDVGAADRAGTYRLFLRVQKDDGVGGVGNYLIDSDGGHGASSTVASFDKGAIKGLAFVSSIARSAYPAGSTFAYGAAGDESVTITATFTRPNGDANVEALATNLVDEATISVGETGASTDVDATTLVQSFVIDGTYTVAGNPYVAGLLTTGNSVLTGQKWTNFATTGHGANIVYFSDVFVYDSSDIAIDGRIAQDKDSSATFATADETALCKLGSSSGAVVTAYNRGEGVYCEAFFVNARSELLSRAMTIARRDSGASCVNFGSVTPTSNKYSETDTIATSGGSCSYPATDPGATRFWRTSNTDQVHDSGTVLTVSSLYYVDAQTQLSDPVGAQDTAFVIRGDGFGGDDSDTTHGYCHVDSVRQDLDIDTSGSAVSWNYKDPTTTTRLSGTTDTGTDGWTPHQDQLASTPLGTWTFNCSVTFNGNSGSNTQQFTVGVEGGGSVTVYDAKTDPLKLEAAPGIAHPGRNMTFVVSASYLDGTARTGAAADIYIILRDPSGDEIVLDDNPDEIDYGVYEFRFALPADAELGGWVPIAHTTNETGADIGVGNVFDVQHNLLEEKLGASGEPVEIELTPALLMIALAALLAIAIGLTTVVSAPFGANRFLGSVVAVVVGLLAITQLDGILYQAGFAVAALMVAAVAVVLGALQMMADRDSLGGQGRADSTDLDTDVM